MTTGINRAIVEGAEQGIITSSTLMATSRAFDDAVRRAHELQIKKPKFSIGCHVVLLDGEPILPAERVSSLRESHDAGDEGRLRTSLSGFAACSVSWKTETRRNRGRGRRSVRANPSCWNRALTLRLSQARAHVSLGSETAAARRQSHAEFVRCEILLAGYTRYRSVGFSAVPSCGPVWRR